MARSGGASFLELLTECIWSFNIMRLISQAHFGGGQFSETYETVRRLRDADPNWHASGPASRLRCRASPA